MIYNIENIIFCLLDGLQIFLIDIQHLVCTSQTLTQCEGERGEIFPLSVSSVPSQTQSDLIMVLACFNVAKVYSLERVSNFDLSSHLN